MSPQGQVIGYARTSTVEQVAGLDAQMRDLEAHGCVRVFSERVSSVAPRAELKAALAYVRHGDVFVVTKPDRLARSTLDLLNIVKELDARGVSMRILSMGGGTLDTATSMGKLMLTVVGAMAEFERNLMLERQREGIAKAKADGKYRGRVPTALRQADRVVAMHGDGTKPIDIAKALGIGRASVFAILKAAREGQDAAAA